MSCSRIFIETKADKRGKKKRRKKRKRSLKVPQIDSFCGKNKEVKFKVVPLLKFAYIKLRSEII